MTQSDALTLHQRKAEELFAATVLINPDHARTHASWMIPAMLQDEKIREFWQAVINEAPPEQAAIKAGIFSRLIQAQNEAGSSLYSAAFAESIADDIYLRSIAEQIGGLVKSIEDRDVNTVSQRVEEMAGKTPMMGRKVVTWADVGIEFLSSLTDENRAVNTGFPKIQTAVGGIGRQELVMLGGRPNMGKTAFALQLAQNAANHGYKVLFVSMEMSRVALFARLACGRAEIPFRLYKGRQLSEDQQQRVNIEAQRMIDEFEGRIYIEDNSLMTTADIANVTAKIKPDLLIVDQLGTVKDTEPNIVRRMGEIAWGGKRIARQFDCAALYLVQLSRKTVERDVKVPQLDDLRDSGELEQIADMVWFLHRQDYYEGKNPAASQTDLVVAKNRYGVMNVNIRLMFHGLRQMFLEEAKM